MGKHADKDLTRTSVIRKQQKHFSYQLRILDPATHATNLNPCLVTSAKHDTVNLHKNDLTDKIGKTRYCQFTQG